MTQDAWSQLRRLPAGSLAAMGAEGGDREEDPSTEDGTAWAGRGCASLSLRQRQVDEWSHPGYLAYQPRQGQGRGGALWLSEPPAFVLVSSTLTQILSLHR